MCRDEMPSADRPSTAQTPVDQRGAGPLAAKLVKLRRRQDLSQQQVADALGVSRQTISNWEGGQGVPALDKAAELARLYGVSLDDLVADDVAVVTSGCGGVDQRSVFKMRLEQSHAQKKCQVFAGCSVGHLAFLAHIAQGERLVGLCQQFGKNPALTMV